MKIKNKVLLGLSTLPILVFLLIGIGWFQLYSVNKMSLSSQGNYELSFLAEEIQRGIKNEAISLRNLVLFTDENSQEKELSILQKESNSVSKNITLLESKINTSEQKKMIDNLISVNQKFNVYKNKVIKLVSEGKKEEATLLINNNGHSIHEELFEVISIITNYFETNMKSTFSNLSDGFYHQIVIGSLISLVGIILVIYIVFKSVWQIVIRLNEVSGVMLSVANGSADLSTKVEVKSNDEIDDVANSFNKMVESLDEQSKREQSLIWSKSNIAEITTSLSGIHDLEDLSRTFLSKVVPLMGSCHAVFYVKEVNHQENETTFKLLASYAFKERKHLSNSFRIGEGLIGQAALEKSPIILTDVPSDYIRVKSGLGEAPPLNLYVLPLIFEGDVKAVLEIASFKPFNLTQQAFLEEIVSGVGILLDSVMGRIQLAKLLEESQMLMEEIQAQSEELQSQQEELKATNEELEEQTQALRQSEEKLQSQQEELEQTNAELEEKAKSLEEQNKRFEITNREVERARSELEEKAKQLTLSSKYKSEFLANMSHELRTPLNSLLILSKLLSDNLDGNLTDKQVEYSKTIYSSGSDLLTLINDILDLAKIESGKMTVNPSKISIKDLADFVEHGFRPIANEKNLSFNIVLKEGIPNYIFSDEQRIQQLLKNLLSNAFKFTHQGSVTLEISITDQSIFSFSIVDTGIGIPKEKQELIFQAFQQADGTTSRKYGGTGLGLSICREIAGLLGGEILVDSEEGKGSTFTFYISDYQEEKIGNSNGTIEKVEESNLNVDKQTNVLNVEAKPPKPIQSAYINTCNNNIKKVLVVEDDLTQRNSLMELIGDKNVIIKAVSSGTEAIEELKVNQFDCIILDLGLSDTSGFELLENIKSSTENENIKVIIYTGRDLTSKEEIYLNKYAHTIIIKDEHSPQRLKDELELYLNANNENVEMVDPTKEDITQTLPYLKGKKILLVDDDVRNVYALSSILEIYGMNITFAENGREGLEILNSHSNFDLVLMDIMMPEMDGYEAIRTLRANPKYNKLPIIALTAKAMKEDRDKCLEVGASDYIVKPVDPDQLISLIKVWLYSY